ncbi:MAG: Bacterial regulatory proteins, gntR family [Lentisphaerae bacterium ADurb.Bin242]|nr:MAG: Bacterial regulatory proteins, gntR family [Lentisphaerae bacterium ADurb.Bin242]
MIKHKHQQLFDLLQKELRDGAWPEGTKLPNLKELAAQYSVSINVASKAVELLKDVRLVTVKVGDGIYSATSGQPEFFEFKYSGDRLFGRYYGAKQLNVLLEDCTDWQLEFWNPFFEKISVENPDIELKVSYNRQDGATPEKFDLGFGCPGFLYKNGFTPETSAGENFLHEFYGDVYKNLLIPPGAVPYGKNVYLPYGFIYYRLLTADKEFTEPRPGENVLDYIERHAKKFKKAVGYAIENCERFLANSGLSFASDGDTVFQMPPREKMLSVFHRIRDLYQTGHLIFPHGHFSDYDEIYKMPRTQSIRIAEYGINRGNESDKRLLERGLRLLHYPAGKGQYHVPMVCAVRADTLFPEECYRILLTLLREENQKSMRENRVAQTILPGLCPEDIRPSLPPKRIITRDSSLPQKYDEVINYIVDWEFFYYLEGRRNEEVFTLIEKKAEHFLNRKTKG